MTYRDRRIARAERLREWADKRDIRAHEADARVHAIADNIPLGQPILVGHHSEAHARRDQERIQNGMHAMIEHHEKAADMRSRADGIEHALDRSVYSDDPDAIEALQARITANEQKRDQMKRVNAFYRKGDAAGLAALGINMDTLKAKLAAAGSYWGSAPHLPYELSNLGGRITADRERIKVIQARAARQEKAEAAGVLIEGTEYIRVTFPEKPDPAVLDALKAAGYYWQGGSWSGYRAKLPAAVLEVTK